MQHGELGEVDVLICDIISAPTMTRAAAATSSGTTWVSGVKNIAARNSSPVTTFASPVRAPSPMPAPDSMKTVFDEPEVAAAGDSADALDDEGRLEAREVALLIRRGRPPSAARSWCPWRRRSW